MTWIEITQNIGSVFNRFQAPKEWIGFAVGGSGLIIKYLDSAYVSVELVLFLGNLEKKSISLEWITGSETNNQGFYIEKSYDKINWKTIGFLDGNGTSTSKKKYIFIDNDIISSDQYYRLKQIDFNGNFSYSNVIHIKSEIELNSFKLYQNFPNPFNPETTIKYTIKDIGLVTLKVYDILGNEVATLVNEVKQPGNYKVPFSAGSLASGVYFYNIITESYSKTLKMVILK